MSPFNSSDAPAAMVKVLPGTAALTVAALLPFKSSVIEPDGSVRLLARFSVGVFVRLSVPVPRKIVPVPSVVVPPFTVKVCPAAILNVPASLTRVRPVLVIDKGRSALIVPRFATCAFSTFDPPAGPELRSVPLFVNVPVVRFKVDANDPPQQV